MVYLNISRTRNNAVEYCNQLFGYLPLIKKRLFIHTSVYLHKTHYEILGVAPDATPKEIKQAFYRKSKELHPDNLPGGNSTRFLELKTAYDVLRRPADRRAYDNRDRNNYNNAHTAYNYQYRPPHYDDSMNWRQFWRENPAGNMNDAEYKKRLERQWRAVLMWTALGVALVVIYNVGYGFLLFLKQRELSQLVDKDEIARSFLRQSEFKNCERDDLEFESLTRILKSDVDEAWKRKNEELGGKNRDEIREEYRWLRAVQDADHHRRIKAKRAEERRHQVDFIWRKKEDDS